MDAHALEEPNYFGQSHVRTPLAARTFAALADPALRRELADAIAEQIDGVAGHAEPVDADGWLVVPSGKSTRGYAAALDAAIENLAAE